MRPHEKHGRVWRKSGRGWTRVENPRREQSLSAACIAEDMLSRAGFSLLPYQHRILRAVLDDPEAELKI